MSDLRLDANFVDYALVAVYFAVVLLIGFVALAEAFGLHVCL